MVFFSLFKSVLDIVSCGLLLWLGDLTRLESQDL